MNRLPVDIHNFVKAVKFSPDGLCLLSSSEDNCVRLFELPASTLGYSSAVDSTPEPPAEPSPAVLVNAGETVYDIAWFPLMSSSRPETCVFATTQRDAPISLWDAFTGQLRTSYRAYDQADEIASALSLAFDPQGIKLYCGFNKTIRIFDVSRGGRDYRTRNLLHTRRRGGRRFREGQSGLISCIQVSPDQSGVYAAGSYNGSTCLYDEKTGELLAALEGHPAGVTHLRFSPNGKFLFTGGRKDNYLLCWDIRNTKQVLARFHRTCASNQRLYFDVDPLGGRFLATGSDDGSLQMFDLSAAPDPDNNSLMAPALRLAGASAPHSGDVVSGVSFHPALSQSTPMLATCSGRRVLHVPSLTPRAVRPTLRLKRPFIWRRERAPPTPVKRVKRSGDSSSDSDSDSSDDEEEEETGKPAGAASSSGARPLGLDEVPRPMVVEDDEDSDDDDEPDEPEEQRQPVDTSLSLWRIESAAPVALSL